MRQQHKQNRNAPQTVQLWPVPAFSVVGKPVHAPQEYSRRRQRTLRLKLKRLRHSDALPPRRTSALVQAAFSAALLPPPASRTGGLVRQNRACARCAANAWITQGVKWIYRHARFGDRRLDQGIRPIEQRMELHQAPIGRSSTISMPERFSLWALRRPVIHQDFPARASRSGTNLRMPQQALRAPRSS